LFNIGPQELLLILVVALVIVGPKRLPELSRTIGKGLRELRKAQEEVTKTINLGLNEPPQAPAPHTKRGTVAPAASEMTGDAEVREVPPASEAPPTQDTAEVVRSLGRGLAEIRRARENIQRTFRVDLSEPSASEPGRPSHAPASPTPVRVADEPAGAPSSTEQEPSAVASDPEPDATSEPHDVADLPPSE
jgi:sec-independent protein translocase protein TatA